MTTVNIKDFLQSLENVVLRLKYKSAYEDFHKSDAATKVCRFDGGSGHCVADAISFLLGYDDCVKAALRSHLGAYSDLGTLISFFEKRSGSFYEKYAIFVRVNFRRSEWKREDILKGLLKYSDSEEKQTRLFLVVPEYHDKSRGHMVGVVIGGGDCKVFDEDRIYTFDQLYISSQNIRSVVMCREIVKERGFGKSEHCGRKRKRKRQRRH